MRYELTDDEWTAIKAMLPNKPRGVPRVNDRRVLNGIFWVLRSGAPWRDPPRNSNGEHAWEWYCELEQLGVSVLIQPATIGPFVGEELVYGPRS
jgi:hypothetical protein